MVSGGVTHEVEGVRSSDGRARDEAFVAHWLEAEIDRVTYSPILAFNFGSQTASITHDGEFSDALIELMNDKWLI